MPRAETVARPPREGDVLTAIVVSVHPIERLRYVARAAGVPQRVLLEEAAGALAGFSYDPTGLVTACRRMVSRQPTSAPLQWLAARVLSGADPRAEAREVLERIGADPTVVELRHAVADDALVCLVGWSEQVAEALPPRGDVSVLVVDPFGDGFARQLWRRDVDAVEVSGVGLGAAVVASDLVLLETTAVGTTDFLGAAGSRAAAAVARDAGVPVWLVAGEGRLAPEPMWQALVRRALPDGDEPWEADLEVVPLRLVDAVVGPAGPEPVEMALARCDCPVVPELLRNPV